MPRSTAQILAALEPRRRFASVLHGPPHWARVHRFGALLSARIALPPEAHACVELHPRGPVENLGARWLECFASYRELLAYVVPQDRAMATQPWQGTVSRHEIDLGIPLDTCEPLEGEVRSRAAGAIAGDVEPLCFRVASVSFLFTGEELDRLPDA